MISQFKEGLLERNKRERLAGPRNPFLARRRSRFGAELDLANIEERDITCNRFTFGDFHTRWPNGDGVRELSSFLFYPRAATAVGLMLIKYEHISRRKSGPEFLDLRVGDVRNIGLSWRKTRVRIEKDCALKTGELCNIRECSLQICVSFLKQAIKHLDFNLARQVLN